MAALIGFLSGMGEAGVKLGQQHMKYLDDSDLQKERLEAEEQKEARLIALRATTELDMVGKKADATADATLRNMPKMTQAKSQEADAAAQDNLRNAGTKGEAKKTELLAGEYSDEILAKKLDTIGKEVEARGKAETQALIGRGTDPKAIQATRNLAQAQHVESSGSTAQAELARLSIEEKKEVKALVDEYTTTKDAERKSQIKETLILKGVIKPDEQQTDKVTTEVMNPDGTTTKTERTVKRKGAEAEGKPSQESAHEQAKAAIAKGASAEAVNKRLTSMGFAPLGEDKPKAGEKKAEKPADRKPVDRLGDQPIGPLTPLSDIEEAARAGNKRAQEYLQRKASGEEENRRAPRTAAAALIGGM
jgi:hypothetical protein